MKKTIFLLTFIFVATLVWPQVYKTDSIAKLRIYKGIEPYEVQIYPSQFKRKKPRNVILMIGDGMGVTQVFAGLSANRGHLFLDNFKSIGFSKTQSADNYITDSAAGATALSTGVKTFNKAIGVNSDTVAVKTSVEEAEGKGLATGLVSTSTITHATPASFIAHQPHRDLYQSIAADFLKTDIDVFIGGGYNHFAVRKDGRNLVQELENKGYIVLQDINEIKKIERGKLAGLTAPEHNPRAEVRGDMLQVATKTAINILDKNRKGFFLMVEGSQIDNGGHDNETGRIVSEMLDFDKTIGCVLDFAAKNKNTLIIVTADHETGGFSLIGGNLKTGDLKGEFTSKDHTAVMVPVFAFGPGAENFTGIMENTDIHDKIKKLLLGE
jgi:alkaline phosphatase